jgi:hypothetical protein
MLVCLPVPGYLAKWIRDLQRDASRKTDTRVRTITESMSPSFQVEASLTVINQCWASFEWSSYLDGNERCRNKSLIVGTRSCELSSRKS